MESHSFICHLQPTRLEHVRAEQYLKHYIRYEVLYVAAHFTDLETIDAWVELSVPGFEPQTSTTLREWTHRSKSLRFNQLSLLDR